jgi:hypothetical protein
VLSIALFALLRFAGKPPVVLDRELTPAERDEIAADAAEAEGHAGLNIGPDLKLSMNVGANAWLDPLQRRIDLFNRLSRQERGEQIFAGMLRYGPYAAFALLPLFALLMKLVYVGRVRRSAALLIWAIVYLLWSMKTVYGGRWSGVLARALVIVFAYSVFFAVVIGGLVVAAIMLR